MWRQEWGKENVMVSTKWKIIGMKKTGMSYRQIASKLRLSKTCVQQTIRKHNEFGSAVDKQRSGRPRVTTPRGDRALAVIAKKYRIFPFRQY